MVKNKAQWATGNKVRVGFLVLLVTEEPKGKGGAYQLTDTKGQGRRYEFTPYLGLYRIND